MKRMKYGVCLVSMMLLLAATHHLPGQTQALQRAKPPTFKVQLKPDLQVAFPRVLHRPILMRSIRLTVRNTGNAPAKKFFVDFILSTDQKAPLQYATFSKTWHEDVLVKGGRMHIDHLAAGASRVINLPLPIFKPKETPKIVFLGAVADSGKAVAESNEANNMAFTPQDFPAPKLINITGVHQTTIMGSDTGNIELHIAGTGFGATPGTKTVKLGSHTIPVEEYNGNFVGWTNTWINALVLDNLHIPYGQTYGLRIVNGTQTVSNTVQVLLKLDFEGIMLHNGNGLTWQAHPGDILWLYAYKLPPSQGNWTVHFGPQTVPVTSWTTQKIVVTCPSLPPGNIKVWIAKNGVDVCLSKYNFQILPQ